MSACCPTRRALLYPKQHTLFAARAAGILPFGFIGSIADFRDQEAFRAIVRRSKRFGFVGASAIHPLQVPVLNEEFSPTDAEVERAERMVAAYDAAFAQGLGAVQFEGAHDRCPGCPACQEHHRPRGRNQARTRGRLSSKATQPCPPHVASV